ncbi:MAG TPA: FHA domain-containing protein, partial [Pyrinomonadaceae bacterium]|nr:FHA domain-containing protein [Pyrinomonadaceae bacterium]
VQAVWDETESGHTMVTPRADMARSTAPVNFNDTIRETSEEANEQTVVRPRVTELYSLEIWHNGVREMVVPITKPEITIGRGSRSITVDLPLKGDPEVSRVHATLTRENDGRYWLVPKGRNPTLVGARELPREERSEILPDQKIAICTFVLRIQPA